MNISPKKPKIEFIESGSSEEKIDLVDEKILKMISVNARMSLMDISKRINVSFDVVRYRLKRLKEREIGEKIVWFGAIHGERFDRK